MLWRMITGQANFFLMNVAVIFAPISLVMVCWTMAPFWISIIAYFINGERIIPLEVLSMIICFSMVVIITTQSKDMNGGDEETVVYD